MTDRLSTLPDDALGAALRDLGPRLDAPAAEHLVAAVRARIEGPAPAVRRAWLRPRTRLRAVALATAIVMLLAGAAIGAVFVIRGFELRQAPSPGPGVSPDEVPALGTNLGLGKRVTLDEARERVRFEIRVPTALGDPDEVHVGTRPSGGRVDLLYRARPGLPAVGKSRVGLLLTEFLAALEESFLGKEVEVANTVERVTVGGLPGYWIEGPHTVYLVDQDGDVFRETARLAGNTLIWQGSGGVTLRLESSLGRDRAVEIAELVV